MRTSMATKFSVVFPGQTGNGIDLTGHDASNNELYLDPQMASTDHRLHFVDKTIAFSSTLTAYEYTVIAYKSVNGLATPTASSPTVITVAHNTTGPHSNVEGGLSAGCAVDLGRSPPRRPDWAGWNVYRSLNASADPNNLTQAGRKLNSREITEDLGSSDRLQCAGGSDQLLPSHFRSINLETCQISRRSLQCAAPFTRSRPAPTGLIWRRRQQQAAFDWIGRRCRLHPTPAGPEMQVQGYKVYRKLHHAGLVGGHCRQRARRPSPILSSPTAA